MMIKSKGDELGKIKFVGNLSRSTFLLFGTKCIICGRESGYGACSGLGTLDRGATLPYVCYGAGIFEGTVLSCTLLNHGGSLFYNLFF